VSHPDAEAMKAWAEYVEDTGIPLDRDEAVEVLDAWHTLDTAGGGLHDQLAECVGAIAEDGRCKACGRLVVIGAWKLRAHQDGGCLYAIPFVGSAVWVWQHKLSLPLVGQAIYRRRRARLGRGRPELNGDRP
jgi:hypothetical protein